MDCILRSKTCLSDTHTPSDPYPTPSLPKGSLYPSTSAPEPLSRTPDHSSCLGLCPLQYFHPMSLLGVDTCGYSTFYQVDRTPSEFLILVRKFPALIWTVPALIRKSFRCSTRVVCLRSPLDFVRTLLDFIRNYGHCTQVRGTASELRPKPFWVSHTHPSERLYAPVCHGL
jgi:hypothetical protein